MRGCATREVLAALLDERLAEPQRSAVEEHVESCRECQERLEELSGRSFLPLLGELTGLKQAGRTSRLDASVIRASVRAGKVVNSPMPSTIQMDHLVAAAPHPGSSSGTENMADLPAVDGYELLSLLGHGGMGVVYKARHLRLNRQVALKMIRPDGCPRTEHLSRLRLEAQTVASLCHPNIVQVYDIGETGGLPYVCLELLEGGSLDERMGGNPQPPRVAAEIIATLALAIHEAHRAGIVHRDLKPTNVLFAADGTPKVTDFGLAKRIEHEDGHTRTGQIMGSPCFMAPEQARGRRAHIGPATDVYSLGAILYQLLTGRPPFKGITPVETVMQVLHDEPVAPSKLQSRIPRDLETVCLKCLEKDPRRRYGSAEELAEELGRFLAGEPIMARPTPVWERGWKWARRRPGKAMAATLSIFFAVFCAIGLLSHFHRKSLDEQRLADWRLRGEQVLLRADEARQHQDWQKAELLLTNLQTALSGEPRLVDLHQRAGELLELNRRQATVAQHAIDQKNRFVKFCTLRDIALECDAEFAAFDQPANIQATRTAACNALQVYGKVEDDRWIFGDRPRELQPDQLRVLADGVYELMLVLAEAVARPLPGEDAKVQAERGLAILDQAARMRPETRALWQRRADCLARAGRQEEAQIARNQAQMSEPKGAFEHFLCGRQYYKQREFAAALAHFEIVVQIQPDHFWAHCLMGICALQEQRAAEATAIFTACLRQKPDFWQLYLVRGTAYAEVGRIRLMRGDARKNQDPSSAQRAFALAEADFDRALAHPLSAGDRYRVLNSRGLMRLRAGRLEEAAADLRQAIAISPGPYTPYRTLAQVYRQQGRLDLADQALTQAIERHPKIADLYRTRAQYALERSELPPELCERALADLDEATRLYPSDRAKVANDHARRGLLFARMQRYPQALQACRQALALQPAHADAHRLQVALLLELKQFDEVISAVNAALKAGTQTTDLFEVRGLARVGAENRDVAGAIEDYTHALRLRPDSGRLYCLRGWAYTFADATKLALTDFDRALALEPNNADALNGRGFAYARLGQIQEALEDAASALQYGDGGSRTLYNTARIYAQIANTHRPQASAFEEKARELLHRVLAQLPADRQLSFWKSVISQDETFQLFRQREWFTALKPGEKPKPAQAELGANRSAENRN